jgi:hypothetical protein
VQRLRDIIASTNPPLHEDLSLVALVPKFRGRDKFTLEEFLSTIDGLSSIVRWTKTDRVEVALLKIAGIAKSSYVGCTELHETDSAGRSFRASSARDS